MKMDTLNAERAQAAERNEQRAPSASSALFALRLLLLAAAVLVTACCAKPCPEKLVSIDQIVTTNNANAASVPRLWARVEMDVTVKPKGAPELTWRSGSPNCLLLYRRGKNPNGPHDFVLIGRETAAVELFRMGSSTNQGLYYFWYKFGDDAGAWYGRLALAGAPGVREMPIDPMQLLGVLGITPLPDEPGQVPAVVLSMNTTPGRCAYVASVIDRQPVTGRVLMRREIVMPWTDDQPPRPQRVNILDNAGRRVMTATLADYKPIDVSSLDNPPKKSPVMPTDIDIVCNDVPGVGRFIRRIHLRISKMTVEDIWLPEAVDFKPPAGVVPTAVDAGLEPEGTRPATQPAAATGPAKPASSAPDDNNDKTKRGED